jgi:hypothetical protein
MLDRGAFTLPYISNYPIICETYIFYRKYRAHTAQNAREFIDELSEDTYTVF